MSLPTNAIRSNGLEELGSVIERTQLELVNIKTMRDKPQVDVDQLTQQSTLNNTTIRDYQRRVADEDARVEGLEDKLETEKESRRSLKDKANEVLKKARTEKSSLGERLRSAEETSRACEKKSKEALSGLQSMARSWLEDRGRGTRRGL